MRKGSKKEVPQVYKGPDYEVGSDGVEQVVPGSREYYDIRDLTAEIKRILQTYGFNLYKLCDLVLNTPDFGISEPSTLYRYFTDRKSACIMPHETLLKLPGCMEKLGKSLEAPPGYFEKVSALREKISQYCIETKLCPEEMEKCLKARSNEELRRYLRSIYVMELSEEAWCYWLCYRVLNSEKQKEAASILLGCTGWLPQYNKLFALYAFNREADIAFQHLILTAEDKYATNDKNLKTAYIEIALNHFKKKSDKVSVYRRTRDIMNFGLTLNHVDWSILLTYDHLCDKQEISRAWKFVLSTMENEKNLEKSYTLENANLFRQRLKTQIDEREENELEQYLSSD